MPKARHVPQRTCVGCGEVEGKRQLLRIVRTPEGGVALDLTGKRNGRGAYVHREGACFERAVSGRLWKALRAPAADAEPLRTAFAALLEASPPRGPQTHRAPVPQPEHLVARGRRGPARTAARRRSAAGSGDPPLEG